MFMGIAIVEAVRAETGFKSVPVSLDSYQRELGCTCLSSAHLRG